MKRMTAIAALVASIVLAPTAHADAEQDYLNELTPQVLPQDTPGALLRVGREVCDDLHHGMSPEAIPGTLEMGNVGDLIWGPPTVAAAQHHLCPDTLGQGG
jgi:Protein of unknown function (DUF732)